MSNFIKMNYVAQGETSARVINPNSNPIMAQKEREWLHAGEGEEEEFTQGIAAPAYDVNAMADQILEDARTRADKMLNDAHAQSLQTKMDAEQEAKAVFEDRKAAGFAEGKKQAEEYLTNREQEIQEQFEEKSRRLEEEYQERYRQMEGEIVDALGEVLERTFGVFVKDQKDVLMTLIDKTIMNLELGKGFKIRVCPENFKFVQNAIPELTEKVGGDVTIDVQNDAKLGSADCIIETDFGVYHCGIDVQLENLITKMKALSI